MRKSTIAVGLSMLVTMVWSGPQLNQPASGEEPQSVRERFLTEAPIAWEQAEQLDQNLEVEVTEMQRYVTTAGEWVQKMKRVAKVHDNMKLIEMTIFPGEGKTLPSYPHPARQEVNATNKEYSFIAKREGDGDLVLFRNPPPDDKAKWTQDGMFHWPWSMGIFHLPDVCRSKGFELKSVTEIREHDRSFVQIDFNYSIPFNPQDRKSMLRGGQVVLDPQRSWSVVRGEVQYLPPPSTSTFSIVNEYLDRDHVAMRSAKIETEQPNGIHIFGELTFDKYERRVVPEQEFTAETYGLRLPPKSTLNQDGRQISYFGKAAPALQIVDARGVPRDVKLEDFRGKWVLLEFWGPNCPPCLEKSLPALTKFYEEHQKQRDQFEILSICVVSKEEEITTMDRLDSVIAPVVQKLWQGKPLPFPIVIDDEMKTFTAYEVKSTPCSILIDPAGNAVNDGDETALAEKLTAPR